MELRYKMPGFQMFVLYGRRRVGKTRLIQEFCKNKRILFHVGIQQTWDAHLRAFSQDVLEQRIVLVFVWQKNGTTESLASSLLGKRWVFPTFALAGRVVWIRRMRWHSAVSGILFRIVHFFVFIRLNPLEEA